VHFTFKHSYTSRNVVPALIPATHRLYKIEISSGADHASSRELFIDSPTHTRGVPRYILRVFWRGGIRDNEFWKGMYRLVDAALASHSTQPRSWYFEDRRRNCKPSSPMHSLAVFRCKSWHFVKRTSLTDSAVLMIMRIAYIVERTRINQHGETRSTFTPIKSARIVRIANQLDQTCKRTHARFIHHRLCGRMIS
jgi:hypothetical protein